MTLVPGLPPGYSAEAGSTNAIAEAADCLAACSQAEIGYSDISAETLNAMWTLPHFDIGRDVVIVRDGAGTVVGVETSESRKPFAKVYSFGGVRPGHTGRGVGSALMRWASIEAERRIVDAAPDIEVAHEVFYPAEHEPSQSLMSQLGFVVDRYHNAMALEFDGPPEPANVPDGIEIRQIRVGVDEVAGALAADEAFADHYGHVPSPREDLIERFNHWVNHEDSDPSLMWLAWDGEEVAGNLWGWPIGDANPEHGYIGSLGVRRPWRGRGLGRALLLWSFSEFYERGRTGVELEVDSASLTGALGLYESVGMKTTGVYAQGSRVLRPGRSLATTDLA